MFTLRVRIQKPEMFSFGSDSEKNNRTVFLIFDSVNKVAKSAILPCGQN